MLVLGIDPGTRHLGWGLVRSEGNRVQHLNHGVVTLPASLPLAQRLVSIEQQLARIIDEYRPDAGSVEALFFHKDAQAASKLGHARGVVLMCLARAGLEVHEYAPTRVKATVTGHGHAGKHQVAMMMRTLLSLDELPRNDATDALALAVTHLRRAPLEAVLRDKPAAKALQALARRRAAKRPRRPVAGRAVK